MDFAETVNTGSSLLTEGAVIERLRRNPDVTLDPHILHAGLIYDTAGRETLSRIHRQYLDIGLAHQLPMIILTPTWRASRERMKQAGFGDDRDVNGDCVRFMGSLRAQYGSYAQRIFIGGNTACAGDAYRPEEALTAEEAAAFHRYQVRALVDAGVDFLLASTLPAASEALGIAMAMAECQIPYVLSFVLKPNGELLDGTPLREAILSIDASTNPAPFFYMANCVHPTTFEAALTAEIRKSPTVTQRLIGLQANASRKSPEELEKLSDTESTDPEDLAESMLDLRRKFGTRILGGCCGTNERHIASLARKMKGASRE
jgi:homocysteine S-methyltransferase